MENTDSEVMTLIAGQPTDQSSEVTTSVGATDAVDINQMVAQALTELFHSCIAYDAQLTIQGGLQVGVDESHILEVAVNECIQKVTDTESKDEDCAITIFSQTTTEMNSKQTVAKNDRPVSDLPADVILLRENDSIKTADNELLGNGMESQASQRVTEAGEECVAGPGESKNEAVQDEVLHMKPGSSSLVSTSTQTSMTGGLEPGLLSREDCTYSGIEETSYIGERQTGFKREELGVRRIQDLPIAVMKSPSGPLSRVLKIAKGDAIDPPEMEMVTLGDHYGTLGLPLKIPRKRGRPRKLKSSSQPVVPTDGASVVKRKRGRPRKEESAQRATNDDDEIKDALDSRVTEEESSADKEEDIVSTIMTPKGERRSGRPKKSTWKVKQMVDILVEEEVGGSIAEEHEDLDSGNQLFSDSVEADDTGIPVPVKTEEPTADVSLDMQESGQDGLLDNAGSYETDACNETDDPTYVPKGHDLQQAETGEQSDVGESSAGLQVRRVRRRKSKRFYTSTYTKDQKRVFNCQICGQRCIGRTSLIQHLDTHKTNEKEGFPFKCPLCEKFFSYPVLFAKHLRIHTGERPFQCGTCGKSYRERSHLTNHLVTHTGERVHECKTCGKSFSYASTLQQHERSHTGERPYVCGTCGAAYRHSSTLKSHIRIHEGIRPYKCNICLKAFTQSSTLKQHQSTHTSEKPFICDQCGKSFGTPNLLRQHLKSHRDYKEFKCDVCDQEFTAKHSLKCHQMSAHTAIRPYCCVHCPKAFPRMTQLKRHLLLHGLEKDSVDATAASGILGAGVGLEEIKPFVCQECGHRFSEERDLNFHLISHKTAKPHHCGICSKSFSRPGRLLKHMQSHSVVYIQVAPTLESTT